MTYVGRNQARHLGIKVLLQFLRPYRWPAACLIALGVLASLFETVSVSLIIPVLQMLPGQATDGAVVTDNFFVKLLSRPFAGIPREYRLQIIVVTMLVLIVLKNLITYTLAIWTSWLRIRLERDLSLAIFDQLMRVSYRFITERSTGDFLSNLSTETTRASIAVQIFVEVLTGLFLVAAYAGLLLLISWPLTLIAVAFLLLLSWIVRWPVRSTRALGKDLSRAASQLSQGRVESLAAMHLIRAFGRELFELGRYRSRMIEMNQVELRSARLAYLTTPLAEVLSVTFLAVFLLVATRLIIDQSSLVVPLLLTFVFVLYRLLPRVANLNSLRVHIALHLAGADSVARILDPRDKPYVINGTRQFTGLREVISFEHVTFSYRPEEGLVLRDISLRIPAGRTTALIGVSGVGKSTLADLLLRFYDPDSGYITVDGVDLRGFDLSQWRAAIGVVSQETFVFNAALRENIAYGKLDATDEEIITAAQRANAHEFIMAMIDGYDTVIGDRGVRLSAGQRQRIAIARAILRNPQILILDEATSALDSESEWQVRQALYELSVHRTVLVIAHRLSTVVHADQIIVLDEGEVVEHGTHPELLAQRGYYSAFWRLQSAEQEAFEN